MPANATTSSRPKPTLNSIYAKLGGWQKFLLSYGLKPYNDDDVEEGKSIAQAMLDQDLKEWEEEEGMKS
jgi:hypothetical protein